MKLLNKNHLLAALIAIGFLSTAPALADGPVCDAKAFGAKGDGKTIDTAAIQSAIDHCAGTGGTVLLRDGTFMSGTIRLQSGMTFSIAPNATLKGTRNDADYPDLFPRTVNTQLGNCRKALVYAEGVHNLTLNGGGTIDGNGGNPNWVGKEATRPMAVFIALSDSVLISDLKVEHSGMWSVVNLETDHLAIRGISVHSPDGPTRDGIDLVDTQHVIVENCTIDSEDDSICLKSGSPRGVYDVTVRNCRILRSGVANGLKLGTASTGGFKKILFDNIQMQNVRQAAMAVESVDGAQVDGIQFRGIRFNQTGVAAYVLLGRRASSHSVGFLRNVLFDDIVGTTNLPWGSAISGSTEGNETHLIQNVVFNNVKITNAAAPSGVPPSPPEYSGQYPDPRLWQSLPAFGLYLRHVQGVRLMNSSFRPASGDSRKPIVSENVSDIQATP